MSIAKLVPLLLASGRRLVAVAGVSALVAVGLLAGCGAPDPSALALTDPTQVPPGLSDALGSTLKHRNMDAYPDSLVKLDTVKLTADGQGGYAFTTRLGLADQRHPNDWHWFTYTGTYEASSRTFVGEKLAQ